MTPENALQKLYGNRSEAMLTALKKASIQLADGIERNYRYPLGELGLDLGLDKDERFWMFEANAKPGRSIFKHPELKDQGILALNTMLEYCLYLSSFRRKESQNG